MSVSVPIQRIPASSGTQSAYVWSLCSRISVQRGTRISQARDEELIERDSRDAASLEVDWAKAWLQEYRNSCRYLQLLAMDDVDELEMGRAWLAWWHAACDCREALRRAEGWPG